MVKACFRPALLARRCAASAVLALLITQAAASPEAAAAVAPATISAPAPDAMGRFLAEKALAATGAQEPAESAFVAKVRDKASDMVLTAMNFLGVPYRRGGNSADRGFDCSGFTRQVFETSLGLVLPRRADQQAGASGLVAVKRDELQPGDLVFFNTLKRSFSHVGIYVGEGKFIHAPRPGGEVRVEDMRFAYWAKRFTGGRRAEPVIEPAVAMPSAIAAVPAPTPAQLIH